MEREMFMFRAVRDWVVREERVTADPRSPTMLETFRRVVVRDGAVSVEATRRVVPARVETVVCWAWMARVWVVDAERDVALVWEVMQSPKGGAEG